MTPAQQRASRAPPAAALMLLLLLVAVSGTPQALPLPDSVLSELASHLQADPADLQADAADAAAWDSIISIQRRLDGKGFHKTLQLQVAAAAAAGSVASFGQCPLSLLQPLPSSIFADPYQLEDLTRSGQHDGTLPKSGRYAYTFQLLGPLDLELPAPACHDTALLLHLNTTWRQLQQQQAAPAATLLVPLHAKYPQPYAAGYQGWGWTMTGHVAARLPWPYLLVDCRQQGGALHRLPPPAALQQQQQSTCSTDPTCSQPAGADGSSSSACRGGSSSSAGGKGSCAGGDDASLWLVPAGNLNHEALVSWGTLLVTAVCCLAVSWTALKGQP